MGYCLRKQKKRQRKLGKKGFTLIELIVVIAIVAVLAVIGIPAIAGQVRKAQQALCDSTFAAIQRTVGIIITEMESDGKSADEIYNAIAGPGKVAVVCERAGIDPSKFTKILIGVKKETTGGMEVVHVEGIEVVLGDVGTSNARPGS